MAIGFACSCGQQLEVEDQYAGKRAQCPSCQAVLEVPAAPVAPAARRTEPKLREPEDHEDDIAATAESLNPLDRSNRRRSKRRDDDPRDLDEDYRRRGRRDADDDEDDDDRPRRKRRAALDDDDHDDFRPRRKRMREPEYKVLNTQTVGGAVCMFLGAVLLGIGIHFDIYCVRWIVILAVIGVIMLVRGLVTGRDEE